MSTASYQASRGRRQIEVWQATVKGTSNSTYLTNLINLTTLRPLRLPTSSLSFCILPGTNFITYCLPCTRLPASPSRTHLALRPSLLLLRGFLLRPARRSLRRDVGDISIKCLLGQYILPRPTIENGACLRGFSCCRR